MQSKNSPTSSPLLLTGLVMTAAAVRLLPHPWNFMPTTALAIFAGAQFPSIAAAIAVTFASMFLSDLFLGMHSTLPFVYGALLVILFASRSLRSEGGEGASLSPEAFGSPEASRGEFRAGPLRIIGMTLGSSVFFFLATNLGVFLMQNLYPKNVAGLLECYTAALPFFQNSILSDLLYVAILFGSYEFLGSRSRVPSRATA